jgi:hypothetical protein
MMSKTDIFIIPVAPVRHQAAMARTRKATGTGIRFGILDNSKANADHLLGLLVAGIRASLPVKSVVSLRKRSAAGGAEDAILERLAAEADFVVSAMAD